jgi:hypothetical protein
LLAHDPWFQLAISRQCYTVLHDLPQLGHVLGFRHEHAQPEGNGACTERPGWRALTPYDPGSVMRCNAESRCEGTNGGDYVLTWLDKAGAATLYGEP